MMSRLCGTFCFLERPESLLSRAWKKRKNSAADDLILTSGVNGINEVYPSVSALTFISLPFSAGFLMF
jgi:hypothetical protein